VKFFDYPGKEKTLKSNSEPKHYKLQPPGEYKGAAIPAFATLLRFLLNLIIFCCF